MLRIFKGTSPGVMMLIIITFIAFWINAFIDPQPAPPALYESYPMPLYGIVKYLLGSSLTGGVVFSSLLVILMLYLMVSFNTSVFFINERTFLPAVIFLFFSAMFPENQMLNPVLPASVFLMLAIMRIMDSYRKPGIAYNFFDVGILISTGSLFYCNLIWFGMLAIIGIALLRTGNIKEIIIAIMGLATPYVVTIGLYYVLGKDLTLFFEDIRQNLFGETAGFTFSRLTIIVLIYCGLILVISLGFLIMQLNIKKIKSRKTFAVLIWGFVISLGLYFILPSVSIEMLWLIAIPASYFMVHYFVFSGKKVIPEIFFTGFLILILLIQVFRII